MGWGHPKAVATPGWENVTNVQDKVGVKWEGGEPLFNTKMNELLHKGRRRGKRRRALNWTKLARPGKKRGNKGGTETKENTTWETKGKGKKEQKKKETRGRADDGRGSRGVGGGGGPRSCLRNQGGRKVELIGDRSIESQREKRRIQD